MAEKAKKLAEDANKLKEKAVNALLDATKENNEMTERNAKIKQKIENLKADEAEQEKSRKMMIELTNDLK